MLLWFELDDFDAAIARAEEMQIEIALPGVAIHHRATAVRTIGNAGCAIPTAILSYLRARTVRAAVLGAPPLINKRTMKIPFTGGCACGAVRYECTAEPVAMFCCHCRDCQRASGGAGNYVVVMPANSFKFTRGAPRYHFTASAAIGHHKRGFCAECGSRLTGGENREGTSAIVGINAGSLDDPSWFRPQFDIFALDAQPWDQMDPAIPKYDKYAP